MIYIWNCIRIQTCNLFRHKCTPIPSGHSDEYSIFEGMFLIEGNRHTRDNYIPPLWVKTWPLWGTVGQKFLHKMFPTEVWSECGHNIFTVSMFPTEVWSECGHNMFTISSILIKPGYRLKWALNCASGLVVIHSRKLRCPRNILHLNLFGSFIIRSGLALARDLLFMEGVGLSKDVVKLASGQITFKKDASVSQVDVKFCDNFIMSECNVKIDHCLLDVY